MSIRQAITVVPTVFLFLLLSSATFNRPSKALGEETIRVAVPLFSALGFPLFVASDRGYFQKDGLPVEIVVLTVLRQLTRLCCLEECI